MGLGRFTIDSSRIDELRRVMQYNDDLRLLSAEYIGAVDTILITAEHPSFTSTGDDIEPPLYLMMINERTNRIEFDKFTVTKLM